MQIAVLFQFNFENDPAAASGIEGDVTTIPLPAVGDVVWQSNDKVPFQGKVTERRFQYDLPTGEDLDGRIVVTLCLDRMTIH